MSSSSPSSSSRSPSPLPPDAAPADGSRGELRAIAASAGTGKTHRLADELLDALTLPGPDGAPLVAPEGVVAVTYTRSAAAELEARVRRALVERGQVDLARRLQSARIGTVHAVCTQLIEEHAFALGLPPELRVLDKRGAAQAFDTALAAVVVDDERLALDDLEQRLGGFDFDGLCRRLADRARSNGIAPEALDDSRASSEQSLRDHLPAPKTVVEVELALRAAAAAVLARPLPERAPPVIAERRQRLQRAHDALARGEPLAWSAWVALEDRAEARDVREAAAAHIQHPRLRDDLLRLVGLVFAVTRRAMERYRSDKREQGVVDFTDMEELAHSLVLRPELHDALRSDVQLLLVDEFQDTSPLQLSLFAALRELAVRTVVVGDEKQSIFGFRDAEPALFRAFQASASTTARLDKSWRSRPGLVRAASAIFAPAFQSWSSLDQTAVRLQAAADVDPAALGAHVERWHDDPRAADFGERRNDDELAACGVAELLTTRDVIVRVPGRATDDGQPLLRPLTARDIAVLCMRNVDARKVARALAARGVPALLRRGGLARTWEARVTGAALALWLDGRDAHARATLVRLLKDDDGAALLPSLVASERGAAFVDDEDVRAIVDAAAVDRTAGLVRAFDRVVDLLRLRERCAAREDPAQHTADLAALRALAVRLVDGAFARGLGPTIPGFLARLDALRASDERDDRDDDDDDRGDVAGGDAVTVMTWHKSKGREWPIVVLTGVWRDPWASTFGLVVETPVTLQEPGRPLFGRRLRLWPSPYASFVKGGLAAHLKQSPPVQRAEHAARQESLRLLYVGMTRARDRLVVVGDHDAWGKGMFRALADERGPFCRDPAGDVGVADWGPRGATVPVSIEVRVPSAAARVRSHVRTLSLPADPMGARPAFAPMFRQPSAADGAGRAGARTRIGPAVAPRELRDELVDLNHLGQALHAFFAVDAFAAAPGEDDDARASRRHALASRVRRGFDVERMLTTAEVVALGDRLWAFLDERLHGHRRRTEVPVLHRAPEGSVVRGQIDLLLDLAVDRTDDAHVNLPAGAAEADRPPRAVIVDHKTTFDADVEDYAGQLRAYRDVVQASGVRVVGTWIHLPLLGEVVEVLLDDADEHQQRAPSSGSASA